MKFFINYCIFVANIASVGSQNLSPTYFWDNTVVKQIKYLESKYRYFVEWVKGIYKEIFIHFINCYESLKFQLFNMFAKNLKGIWRCYINQSDAKILIAISHNPFTFILINVIRTRVSMQIHEIKQWFWKENIYPGSSYIHIHIYSRWWYSTTVK